MAKNTEKNIRRAEAIQELREAIKKYGVEAAPKLVREHYLDVPRPTWYRWLNEVAASPMDVAIDTARKAAKQMPATPSPSYLVDKPVEARAGIDFMSRLERLYADAEKLAADGEMLRDYSTVTVKDLEGEERVKIKIPAFFSNSIKLRGDSIGLRASLLETAVKTIQQFYDLRRMQQFYDSILEEIAAESPEVAQRITDRLAKLNAEQGITVDARL